MTERCDWPLSSMTILLAEVLPYDQNSGLSWEVALNITQGES